MEAELGRPTFCKWISFTTVFHYLFLLISFFCIVFSCVFRLPINLTIAGGGIGDRGFLIAKNILCMKRA